MVKFVRVVRNVEFNKLFDDFFISSVTTILVIRFYLKLTGYPQIGGPSLHISHMLPGAILMLVALLLLLAAVNRAVRDFSAMIGGIGFGLIWDELGKYITKDNNYFFKPTPGLIYMTFVLLYLTARWVGQKRLTQDDYLANVLDLLKDSAVKDLDQREHDHAKELFGHVSDRHPMYKPTKALLEAAKPTQTSENTVIDRLINHIMAPLYFLSARSYFPVMVLLVSFLYGLASLGLSAFFLTGAVKDSLQLNFSILRGEITDAIGGLSMLASAGFIFIGAVRYRLDRHHRAYRFFEQALLINILVGQVILFFKNATIAIADLAVTLFLLVNLQILDAVTKRRRVSKTS